MSLLSMLSKLLIFKPRRRPQSCSVVIAAAGLSRRAGNEDKLFAPLRDVPVLVHTLLAFQNCVRVNEIVVVARTDTMNRV